ncbi:MAG: hypothetical protein L0338_09350 [Acidobacteria bacterium]|nr:hypothetical protein [Acidobacteriota bacterium]
MFLIKSVSDAVDEHVIRHRPEFRGLAQRFDQYHVPPTIEKIESFVRQFPLQLIDGVIRMLRSIKFSRQDDFYFLYNKFTRHNPTFFTKAVVCPLESGGGSASLMYYMSAHLKESTGAEHLGSLKEALHWAARADADRIVLLDDAAYSGGQVSGILDITCRAPRRGKSLAQFSRTKRRGF